MTATARTRRIRIGGEIWLTPRVSAPERRRLSSIGVAALAADVVHHGARLHVPLLSGLHVLERGAVRLEDGHEARVGAIRLLELAFQAAPAELDAGGVAGPSRVGGEPERLVLEGGVGVGDEEVDRRGRGEALGRGEQDPLDPAGPSHAGGRRAADLLDQAVVATAAAHAGLGTERVG